MIMMIHDPMDSMIHRKITKYCNFIHSSISFKQRLILKQQQQQQKITSHPTSNTHKLTPQLIDALRIIFKN